jgi:hypothetical protein
MVQGTISKLYDKSPKNARITGRFEIFTAVRMMMFFWVLTPCRLVGKSQRLHLQDFSTEEGGSMFLRNVGIYRRVYTASKPRRPTSSSG